ncbi:hypothetical protein EJB05_17062 [Eragrostis curvula]|uniref:Uncharacterized protein n=1 Tax=Eragrostis curvula TaxID=38414 RepID=A0A5J9VH27_9POAL|nr:hypothetical protein EJB05_17062 [Eragrostis curvula]
MTTMPLFVFLCSMSKPPPHSHGAVVRPPPQLARMEPRLSATLRPWPCGCSACAALAFSWLSPAATAIRGEGDPIKKHLGAEIDLVLHLVAEPCNLVLPHGMASRSDDGCPSATTCSLRGMHHIGVLLMSTVRLEEDIKYRGMNPEEALDHVRSIRPRVLLAPSQWHAVNAFSTLTTGFLPTQSTNCITNTESYDYHAMEFDCEDSGLPLCQVMVPRLISPTVCIDAVVITEADLEGYDAYIDTRKGEVLLEAVTRKPFMRKLSCLFGSLKLNSNCEPAPSRFTEVRAC